MQRHFILGGIEMDTNLKLTVYLLIFLVFCFIFFDVIRFYKNKRVASPIRSKAPGVIEDGPPFTSIKAERSRYLENISNGVPLRVLLVVIILSCIIILIL
jgi:hypothetical protein